MGRSAGEGPNIDEQICPFLTMVCSLFMRFLHVYYLDYFTKVRYFRLISMHTTDIKYCFPNVYWNSDEDIEECLKIYINKTMLGPSSWALVLKLGPWGLAAVAGLPKDPTVRVPKEQFWLKTVTYPRAQSSSLLVLRLGGAHSISHIRLTPT